jgi:plasmid stabilization system protein ParE
MKYGLSILSEAEIDIDKAFIWYETKQSGLGDRFFESLNESILYLHRNPLIYQEIYKGARRCVIKKFPYGIYYKIIPDNNEIQILGIVHFSRDPETVLKRL